MPKKRKKVNENNEKNDVLSTQFRSSARLAAKKKNTYFEPDEEQHSFSDSSATPKRDEKCNVMKKHRSNKKGTKISKNVCSIAESENDEEQYSDSPVAPKRVKKSSAKKKQKLNNKETERTENICSVIADSENSEDQISDFKVSGKKVKNGVTKKNSRKNKEIKKSENICSMIAQSESKYFAKSSNKTLESNTSCNADTGYGESNTSSSSDEWEEVENVEIPGDDLANYKPQIPSEGVQIVVNAPTKKQKKKMSVDDFVRQQINRRLKENQENLHKTHLLCCIAHGLYVNSILITNNIIKAISLSYLTDKIFGIKEIDIEALKTFLEWFTEHFKLVECSQSKNETRLSDTICEALQQKKTNSEIVFILMFISLLRKIESISVEVRLSYAINPLPIKPKNLILTERQREQKQSKKKDNKDKEEVDTEKTLVSSDDDDVIVLGNSQSSQPRKRFRNFWVEVYLTKSKKWVCVDPITLTIDDTSKISENTYDPLLYVFAFDNENNVKDVTQRYYLKWTDSKFRSKRVTENWLQDSLKAFKSPFTDRDDEENSQLTQIISSQPLPSTISAFKNHPLYVLERHLLKYEVIYPQNAPKIGSFRGDNIYSREFVHTVHSDIYWRREGRVVRSGEIAYKIAKARPKWDKIARKVIKDLPLELFGYWQTEPFIPPVAKDGKVPRNEFGNVELFQPTMLPIGTVHIPLPGLLRIANKLGIDCVPAVVGFDCHSGGGGTHPVYDGFVVCEEFKEVLLAAYDEEEENSRKRAKEKKTNRILGNWKRLIKAALIRDKLRKKYSNDE